MSHISVDVDIEDIVWGMSRYDRRKFFEHMKEEGHISEACIITYEGEVKAPSHIERNALVESSDEFNKALSKLYNNGWKLTSEEEQYIINISKRFP